MRIISKFKDYYDSQMVYGFDPMITFVRRTEEIEAPKIVEGIRKLLPSPNGYCARTSFAYDSNSYGESVILSSDKNYVRLEFVVFCGKIYPILNLNVAKSSIGLSGSISYYIPHGALSSAERILMMDGAQESSEFYQYMKKPMDPYSKNKIDRFQHLSNVADSMFGLDVTDLVKDLDCPYFHTWVAKNSKITKNPILKDLTFSKIMDPERCFQEISMYIGMHMNDQMEMVEISDPHRIAGHGFDKMSFRKAPNAK